MNEDLQDETPRLSPTAAEKLLKGGPLSCWANHRLLGGLRKPPTSSQEEGRLWHSALLENAHDVRVIDCDNFKTKAAQALRDEARAAGMIPVPAAKMETLRAAVPNILTELARYDVTLGGEREMRFEWDEAIDPVNAVACSGYIDHWEELRIDELKSGSSITSIEDAAMLLGRTHALLQDAAYRSALADFLTCEPESIEVRFVFFQTEEPFAVTPVTLSGPLRQVSYQRWHRALRLWNACLSKGTEREFWPGPVEAPHSAVVDDPGWMLKREIEMEAREDE